MTKDINSNIPDPFWISGFTDGEGCFSVSFNLKAKLPLGIEVRPSFSLLQVGDKQNLNLNCLQQLREFFSCGFIRFCKRDNTWKYECRNLTDIKHKILPHFINYPLRTKKAKDFEFFCLVVELISSKQHLNEVGLVSIIETSYRINSGKRKWLKNELISKIKKRSLDSFYF